MIAVSLKHIRTDRHLLNASTSSCSGLLVVTAESETDRAHITQVKLAASLPEVRALVEALQTLEEEAEGGMSSFISCTRCFATGHSLPIKHKEHCVFAALAPFEEER